MRTGLAIIKEFEGCRLKAYLCPAKIPTIGWGRTVNVKLGDTCTQAQADEWLAQEYDAFERGVVARISVATNENQVGAMVALAYNIGLAKFAGSTLLKLHNQGKFAQARVQFLRWNKAAGRVLRGLTLRRAKEAALYATAGHK